MAQLKISDLSVGDWVGIDQAELNMPSDDLATACIEKLRKPIRIKGISEDSDMVIADIEIVDEWGSIMMKCEHLRPIPITPEILEKNGFEVYDDTARLELDRPHSLWLFKEKEGWDLHLPSGGQHINLRMKHIHQLQHALRLAGVEKEIEL